MKLSRKEWIRKHGYVNTAGYQVIPSNCKDNCCNGWQSVCLGAYIDPLVRARVQDGEMTVFWDDSDDEQPLMIFVAGSSKLLRVAQDEVTKLRDYFSLQLLRCEALMHDDPKLGEIMSPITRKFDWGDFLDE